MCGKTKLIPLVCSWPSVHNVCNARPVDSFSKPNDYITQNDHWVTSPEAVHQIACSFSWSHKIDLYYIFHRCSRAPQDLHTLFSVCNWWRCPLSWILSVLLWIWLQACWKTRCLCAWCHSRSEPWRHYSSKQEKTMCVLLSETLQSLYSTSFVIHKPHRR